MTFPQNNVSSVPTSSLQAVPLPIYPVMGSLQEVVDYADSKLPIINKNDICSLLGIYHNTLLNQLRQQLLS